MISVSVAVVSAGELALVWQHPQILWLLVLPPLVLLFARIPARPREVATGALALWRNVAVRIRPQAGRKALRPPVWVFAACCALAFGIVALAGPGPEFTQEPRQWTVVFDRGPGMSLDWIAPVGEDTPSLPGTSRSEMALEMTRAHLAEIAGKRDRVRWEAAGREPIDLAPDAVPDQVWLRPLRAEQGGVPQWDRYTKPGSIWVSDRRPDQDPGQAGLILCGGEAVPGPVAAVGDELLRWSADGPLDPVPRNGGTVLLLQPQLDSAEQGEQRARAELPRLLEELIRAWARSRKLGSLRIVPISGDSSEVDHLADDDVVLVIEGSSSAPPSSGSSLDIISDSEKAVSVSFQVRETGFSAQGLCAMGPLDPARHGPLGGTPLSVRWRGQEIAIGGGSEVGAGLPLLYAGPGWVRFTIQELEPPKGDPAAFAVRVAGLLDGALLLPPGVVPVEDRRAAGAKFIQQGEQPLRVFASANPRIAGLGAWLAGLSALAAFVAIASKR